MVKRREDLSTPRTRRSLALSYDSDMFGSFSESIARFLGTARYLVFQTLVIVVWIAYNVLAPRRLQFDPWDRGLVLLTLVLSLQASYAAPLILLAQNRQERRDRVQSENDRNVAERTQADTEFLAREIAGVRLLLSDGLTREELRDELASLTAAIERLTHRLDEVDGQSGTNDDGTDDGAGTDGMAGPGDGGGSTDGAAGAGAPAATTMSTSSTVKRRVEPRHRPARPDGRRATRGPSPATPSPTPAACPG